MFRVVGYFERLMPATGIRAITLAALGAFALAAPGRAEVVTLECIFGPQMSPPLAGTQFTVDFDLDAAIVRHTNGVSYRIDQITDRYIYYGKGVAREIDGSPWRLDRRTGIIESMSVITHAFSSQATCRRVQGKVL